MNFGRFISKIALVSVLGMLAVALGLGGVSSANAAGYVTCGTTVKGGSYGWNTGTTVNAQASLLIVKMKNTGLTGVSVSVNAGNYYSFGVTNTTQSMYLPPGGENQLVFGVLAEPQVIWDWLMYMTPSGNVQSFVGFTFLSNRCQ